MRVAHKVGVLIAAIALLLILLLLPRHSEGAQPNTQDFGDYIVHYSAISTNQLMTEVAKSYGIERSGHRGLLNIAVQAKSNDQAHMIGANISADVADLTGHHTPIQVRETN